MDLAKQLLAKAQQSGKVSEGVKFFSVTDKSKIEHPAGSGNMIDVEAPNGVHRVTILTEVMGKGKSFKGEEQDELQMTILDNRVEKQWNVAVRNEEGNLHYIVQALAEIEKGEEFIVEAFKMRNGKYGKRISRVVGARHGSDEVPVINLEEEGGIEAADLPF